MAYFACAKAALTGTDQATRISIAKGAVSPTFTNFSGQEVLRGTVQMDVVTGRNTGYASGQTIQERLASAGRAITSSTGGTFVYADRSQAARASVATPTPVYQAELHTSDSGVVNTTTSLGVSKKVIAIVGAVIIGIYMVVSR